MSRTKRPFASGPQHVLPRLAEMVEVCDDVAIQLDNLGVAIDDIKQTLGDLARSRPDLNALLAPVGLNSSKKSRSTPASARYASAVTLSWAGPRAEVVIDGKTVTLPRMVGLLMEALLSEAPDPFGAPIRDGWHSRQALELSLTSRAGTKVSKHALENLICRLKEKLRQQAALGEIVQVNGQRDVRIGLEKHLVQPRLANPASSSLSA